MVIGCPALTGWPFGWFVSDVDSPSYALVWLGYAAFISLLIIANIGTREWLRLFSLAAIVTVVTCFTGPTLKAFGDWVGLSRTDSAGEVARSVHYLILGATMLSVVPFGIFCVNCFSASGLLIGASTYGKTVRIAAKHITLGLRVLQHVMEVLVCLMTAWKETNPGIIKPRHRGNLQENVVLRFSNGLAWWKNALMDWCVAMLMHTLEPVPFFCMEIERLSRRTEAKPG